MVLNKNENLPPFENLNYSENPTFGSVHIPIVLWFDLKCGEDIPGQVNIEALADMPVSPFCSTLHYGQSIFEGMKVYRQNENSVGIFRPELHAKRFSRSAQIMSMVNFSPELFLESVASYVRACKEYVPSETGHSLYLRPLLIAKDPVIKLKPSASYRFIIMSSIAGSYFNRKTKGQRVLLNKDFNRAVPGGSGEAKTAANYALSLSALNYAYSKDYDQVLYVDAVKKEKIEEFGGMNFFMVKNEEIYTPSLDGQILHGVTRQSVLEVADHLNIKSHEKTILLPELFDGEVTEVFASGTAAAIAPIAEIGLQENIKAPVKTFKFENSQVGDRIREYLTQTQRGNTEKSAEWLHSI